MLEQPHLFQSYTPRFRYFKIAENEYSPEQLLNLSNLVSALFLAETQSDLDLLSSELLNLFDREEDQEGISLLLIGVTRSDYSTIGPRYQQQND